MGDFKVTTGPSGSVHDECVVVFMTTYPMKRGKNKELVDGGLKSIFKGYFDLGTEKGDTLIGSWGAIKEVKARMIDAKSIEVTSTMLDDPSSVGQDVASETIKRWNGFLFDVTGFNGKQRKKKMEELLKKGK